MSLWLIVLLQAAQASPDAMTFDLALSEKAPTMTVIPRCDSPIDIDEIVVCGRLRDQYRLPLPSERDLPAKRAHGEAPSGMAALTPSGRCGIFAGERHCSKKEKSEYGYGKGRDPVTVLTGLVTKVLDPDAN